jgi:epoxyqueuosine reductase
LFFTDSGPVLERDLAARAGLGFVGKNTCLIDRKKGSLFFIAEIYTTLTLPIAKIDPDEVKKDFCGTCTRCIDACPTGALIAPKDLDARLCISYLTIESRKTVPPELRNKIGDWLFGCDICQIVCPWNIKAHGSVLLNSFSTESQEPGERDTALTQDLRYLLTTSSRQLERDFAGTPLARAGGFGLKRNALVVIANRRIETLLKEVEALLPHPKLGELAQWTLLELQKK